MNQLRQGDVLLVRDEVPSGMETIVVAHDSVVLAYGEATGHAHVLQGSGLTVLESEGGARYVQVPGGATLTHQEHSTLQVPPGTWRVVRQREYMPERGGTSTRYVSD